ncbi:hypothetical protein TNCV_4179941 [Trichonephila clavipes]|nr:hypothetical protein TNCV_4179941 [Trichonephila clavipes]
MKILGIIWKFQGRHIQVNFNISPPNELAQTNGKALSTIAKIYDPLGFLSLNDNSVEDPGCKISGKKNISWDDPVTDCIFRIMDTQ